jgi:hypothetical protein
MTNSIQRWLESCCPRANWSVDDLNRWVQIHQTLTGYDPVKDVWNPGTAGVPSFLVDKATEEGKAREPVKYAPIVRKKIKRDFPLMPADLVEALVTVALYAEVIDPKTVHDPDPKFKTLFDEGAGGPTHSYLQVATTLGRKYMGATCCETTSKQECSEPESSYKPRAQATG